MNLILASTSVYRAELLSRLNVEFSTEPSGIDESSWQSTIETPDELARVLAREKAAQVARAFPDAVVIGADQVVDLNGEALGKPGTSDAAIQQLMRMNGQWHRLLTAVTVLGGGMQIDIFDETRLQMRTLTPDEIARYVALDQPLDCAGSYKIERAGISLFQRIECADFTAIMGLPLVQLSRELRNLGFLIP